MRYENKQRDNRMDCIFSCITSFGRIDYYFKCKADFMNTHVGLMPFEKAEEYGVHLTNRVINLEFPNYKQQGNHGIILNVNHFYGYDSSENYKTQLLRLPLLAIRPHLIVIENEPFYEGDILSYCQELIMAVEVLPKYNVVDGGLTMPHLGYWYYSKTKDEDFFIKNIPTNLKEWLKAGAYDKIIEDVQYYLDVLKSIDVAYVNIHFYFGYPNQVDGLVRMINYVKEYTGKPVTSDEAGTYAPGLLPACVNIARQTEMKHLILYSGDGRTNALPISKEDFENAIK